jgi:hypothetical protein
MLPSLSTTSTKEGQMAKNDTTKLSAREAAAKCSLLGAASR